jgi:hypothetical protein
MKSRNPAVRLVTTLPTINMPTQPSIPVPGARIPVKLHRRVCLIQTEDAVLAAELLARKRLSQEVVGRLTDRVLLVRPGRIDAVVDELQKMGHTPQVVGARLGAPQPADPL